MARSRSTGPQAPRRSREEEEEHRRGKRAPAAGAPTPTATTTTSYFATTTTANDVDDDGDDDDGDMRRRYQHTAPPVGARVMAESGAGMGGRRPSRSRAPSPPPTPTASSRRRRYHYNHHHHHRRHRGTCRLTLVCYRPGSRGVVVRHVRAAHPARFSSSASFESALHRDPAVVAGDAELFREMRRLYASEMCGFWRTACSLRSLQSFRLLSFGDCRLRPLVVPLGESTMQEVMHAYRHPDGLAAGADAWIDWVYRLRRPGRSHALELVEGWDGTRILVAGTAAVLAPVAVAAVWAPLGGDPGLMFSAAGFVLALCLSMMGLVAVLSAIMPSH